MLETKALKEDWDLTDKSDDEKEETIGDDMEEKENDIEGGDEDEEGEELE